MSKIAIALYKPHDGKREELMTIVATHIPLLRSYNLITDSAAFLAESEDGTIIEVFEWLSEEAKEKAHATAEVMGLWERMMPICDFPPLKDLPEAHHRFPNFSRVHL